MRAATPTLIDRMVGYFDPAAALKRLRARTYLDMAASWNGADHSRKAMKSWSPRAGGPNSDVLEDLHDLRKNSRDLARNAPLATGAINTSTTAVVGTGLKPHPQIDREVLGLSEEEADAWERQATRIWGAWAGTTACDVASVLDFAGIQELVFRGQMESGDIFTVRRFDEREGDLLGLRLQVIESDRVCNPNHEMDGMLVAGGVERDRDGRPVAYHILDSHPGELLLSRDPYKWNRIPAFGKTGRLVLHHYQMKRPGQVRGYPFLAPVIEPLKQLERFSEAELAAAVVSAMFTVFIKTLDGEDSSGLAPIDPEDTEPAASTEYKLGSGAVLDLAPGEDVTFAEPKRPNDAFDPFFQAVVRQIGAAIEIPFELMIKHFTSSYSASRAAILEAWRAFKVRRSWLSRSLCQPCYEWVLAESITRGLIQARGFDDPLVRQAWTRCAWIGPAQGQIDPLREINAAKVAVDLGVSTLEEVTAEMTGGSWEQKYPQRVKEERMRREAGLSAETIAERVVSEQPGASMRLDSGKEPHEDELYTEAYRG